MPLVKRKRTHHVQEIRGERFGRLTVISYIGVHEKCVESIWLCKCDCGKKLWVVASSLKRGNTKSCGCLKADSVRASATVHGDCRPGRQTAEYGIWQAIKQRCGNPNNAGWNGYGGRGIFMCERWKKSYTAFLEDMGRRPSKYHSIDRRDNEKGYEKSNCRWATIIEQSENTRRAKLIEFKGESHTAGGWSRLIGGKRNIVFQRLHSGWTVEEALTTPVTFYMPRVARRS